MTTYDLAPARDRSRAEWLSDYRATGWLYVALIALAVAPIFYWSTPRMNDLVDHWARLTLYHQAPGDPVSGLYRVHFGLIPNLGVDLLYLALWPLLSPLMAVKVAAALAIILPASGVFAIHRTLFAKPSPSIFIVPYLSYNVATTVGLVNFAIGAGIALLGIAYAMNRPQGLRARDLVVLNAIGAALFFFHLIALAMYGVLLAGVLAVPLRSPWRALLKRFGVAALAIAAPAVLVLLREHSPSTYNIVELSSASFVLAAVQTMTDWDRLHMFVLIGLVGLALLSGLRVTPQAWVALPAFALFAFLAPSSSGAATLIDARLMVYVWFFALAVTSIKTEEMRDRMRPVLAAAALVAVGFRIWSMAPAWDEYDRFAVTMREFLKPLPMGSRVIVVVHQECDNHKMGAFSNLTTFGVIDRRSYVNTLFAQTGMQPVAPVDPMLDGGPTLAMDARWLDPSKYGDLSPEIKQTKWAQALMDWRSHYTHVIDEYGACASTLTTPGLTKIGATPGFDLYKVD